MRKLQLIGFCILFMSINLNIFSSKIDNYVNKKELEKSKNIFLFKMPIIKEESEKEENQEKQNREKQNQKEKIKKAKKQIVIKAIIIDTSSNLFEKLGVNWALLNGEISLSKILEGGKNNFGVDFNLLRENGDIKIEAMPTLVITEGEVGELRVTEEVIVGEKKTTKSNNEYSEPVFSEAGIVFKILGEVLEHEKIILKIDTEISNFKLTSSYSEKAGAKQKNQTKTVVELEDGKSVFIGGLKQNVDKGTIKKIPILGDIPLLGELFKLKKSSRENRDIYIEIEASIK